MNKSTSLVDVAKTPARFTGMSGKQVACVSALLAGAMAFSGCGVLGAGTVKSGRAPYNMAFASTTDQELLLNIVRLRYRDTPFFLNVDRVAASSTFGLGTGVSGSPKKGVRTDGVSGLRLFDLGISGSANLEESPTVFYSPMEGERYARQMMSRLNFDVLLLLANSGWSIERLMMVTLQEMNGLKNAPTASGPTPSKEPEFREFREALRVLRALQVKGLVQLAKGDEGDESAVLLHLVDGNKDVDALKFKKLLGLDRELTTFPLRAGMGRGDGKAIYVITRPVISTMNYLAQAVVAPNSDVKAGRVTKTLKDSGEAFDWQEMLGGFFKVQSSLLKPMNSSTAVEYRGTWFYIADDDLDSKSTFCLLTQILALQSGKAAGKETPISFSFGK